MPVPVSRTSFVAAHISSQRCWLQDTPPHSLPVSCLCQAGSRAGPRRAAGARPDVFYQAEALIVTDPTANWTVSPLATPVMDEVSAPWSQRSGVAAESHISIAVTVVQDPVADQETALLLVCWPPDGAANPEEPREDPPAE